MRQVELSKGYVALVDDEDYERVAAFKWTAIVTGQNVKRVYAYRRANWDQSKRRWRSQIYLHRFIMNAPRGMDVHHLNDDTLCDLRSNLCICTRSENLARARRINKQGFRGVAKANKGSGFVAQITKDGQHFSQHGFATAIQAAVAFDEMARKLHGEFARLNFPVADKMEK